MSTPAPGHRRSAPAPPGPGATLGLRHVAMGRFGHRHSPWAIGRPLIRRTARRLRSATRLGAGGGHTDTMKLIIFGASGLLGARLVTEALDRGHEVTAVARDLSRLDDRDGRVRTASADATDPDSVAAVVGGHDVAVSAVTQHQAPEMLVHAARALLEGLARASVPRLISVGGAGSLQVAPGQRLVDTPDFHEEWKPEALAGADALEVFRQADADTPVEWSFISPGALLAPGERTGRYRLGGDQLLVDEDGRSHISMEDFAVAILDEVENGAHPRRRFTAAY